MLRKKTGVLIGFGLGFLSQVSIAYAQYMEMIGEYLNPIARWLVKDSVDFVDPNMLWLYVLSYIVVVTVLIYAGLKKNKLFANQHGLAKNLAIFLTLMLITGGSTSAIGIFGLAQGMMPIFVMFLIIALFSKIMPAGAGGPSIARGFGGGGGLFSKGTSLASAGGRGWFSRGAGKIWGGIKQVRAARKLEADARERETVDAQIGGYVGRANALEMQI
jgi:hypothetical protein